MNPDRHTIDNPTGDVHIDRMRGVPTKGDLSGLAARNAVRAKEAAKKLGIRYCCHPFNSPVRMDKRKPPMPPQYLLRVA
jgi:hypothetical protein